jgi:fumarate reductase flavoprotein subunit
MKKMRTWFAADKTGFHMLHTLFQTSLKYTTVKRYDEWFVTKILVDEGRAQGVVAIDLASGRVEAITARAVILCTGGCGKVFPFTTNASINTGDGMSLAYRAGAPLKDMEFVQYHPTGLPFTGILITEAARAEGGYLINKDGYRYLQDYNLGTPHKEPVFKSMELGPGSRPGVHAGTGQGADDRDAVRTGRASRPPASRREEDRFQDPVRSRAVQEIPERRPGDRADSRAAGCPLHDGRRPHRHQRRHAAARALRRRRNGVRQHQRREPACSNSLPDVFGARAGRAAEYASRVFDVTTGVVAQAEDERRRVEHDLLNRRGHERIANLREEMQKTMEESAGIYRTGAALAKGIEQLRRLRARFADIAIEDTSRTFNTERVSALELLFMLDIAETIVASAVKRHESRGAHQRTDFPARDDVRFLAHSLVYRNADGSPRVEYLPVTITRWPPAERVYGEAAAHGGPHHAAGSALSAGEAV